MNAGHKSYVEPSSYFFLHAENEKQDDELKIELYDVDEDLPYFANCKSTCDRLGYISGILR